MATFYINGSTLANSTAVFDDPDMTICAADGFYSDGTIVREQVSCSLLPPQDCPSCNLACSNGTVITQLLIPANGSYTTIKADTGTDVGAILIYFETSTFSGVPEGIRVEQNSVYYNELVGYSGAVFYAKSANPNGFTYTGTGTTGCDPNFGVSTINVTSPNYKYQGGSFNATGGNTTLQIQPTDVIIDSFTGFYMMVVPKTIAYGNILNIEIHAPCSSTACRIEVKCPVLLTGFEAESGSNCGISTFTLTHYNAPQNGAFFGNPSVGDLIFTDAYGENKVAAGNYIINPTAGKQQMVVDANGVITSLTTCP